MWLLFADSLFWFLHECLGGRVSLRDGGSGVLWDRIKSVASLLAALQKHLLSSFGGLLVHLTRIMDHCHL